MGSSYSQPQLPANHVLDYQCDLLDPRQLQLLQRLGPNAGVFPDQGKNQILNEVQECITNANLELVAEFQKVHRLYCSMFAIIIVSCITFIVLIFSFWYFVYFSILIGVNMVMTLSIIFLGRKLQTTSEKWRGYVLAALQPKLQQWKTHFPAFTFTIIYPREEWTQCYSCGRLWASGWGVLKLREQPSLIAVWVYLRITQGLCQAELDEPIFATTGPAQQHITQVVIQQQQYVQQPQQTEQEITQQQPQYGEGHVQQPETL